MDLLVTDPPYNVAYKGVAGKIKNDDMSESEYATFLDNVFDAVSTVLKKGAAFYVWHATSETASNQKACENKLGKVREILIWVKNTFTLGRQDYQWQHEPCLYGWTEGAAHYFTDCRSNSTVIDDHKVININKLKIQEAKDLLHEILDNTENTTIIYEDKPTHNAEHPTMKPVKLIARLVHNSSQKGENVLDVFGGSGTTMMACEQLGRNAYLMELDEKFCDVIIARWEAMTGEQAELIE